MARLRSHDVKKPGKAIWSCDSRGLVPFPSQLDFRSSLSSRHCGRSDSFDHTFKAYTENTQPRSHHGFEREVVLVDVDSLTFHNWLILTGVFFPVMQID